jgi:hypothetical protein
MKGISQLVHAFSPNLDQDFWRGVRKARAALNLGAGYLLQNCSVYLEEGHRAPGFTGVGELRTVYPERFGKLELSFRLLDLDAIMRHSGETGTFPTFAIGTLEDGKAVILCILGCRITDPQVSPDLVREIQSKRSTIIPIDLDFAIDIGRSEGQAIYVQPRATTAGAGRETESDSPKGGATLAP